MSLEKLSPCKVNLLLNILGKRADGFHELETVMQPIAFHDRLTFSRKGTGIQLSCSDATLPTDSRNLVYRAAAQFLEKAGIKEGVKIHLEKRIPMAAGLGGGSGNAATALLGMNDLFQAPLTMAELDQIAAGLGSDIPFFLQSQPAFATGRGEKVQSLAPFPALKGTAFLLIYPPFGIATAWAYQNLARFPAALNGRPGRGQELICLLQGSTLPPRRDEFYNSLEAPALDKYPLLALFQEFLLDNGALAARMSGSGSTTFAIARDTRTAEELAERFKSRFGANHWLAVVPA